MSNLIGKVLLDQFRVDSFLASGGMGAVYRVWDLKRNVPLAMKVLHGELAEDPAVFKRFQREANALKKLAHPHIVPFYGLFQVGDLAFLLERYVDGPSLKDVIARHEQPMRPAEALIYLKVLASALGYAHVNNVVHCDVKPGNVIIDSGGNIFLADFGIARHESSTTTTAGSSGTPAYMAPEQVRGGPVSAATDVYALGVMLYEMLTGRRPFRGDQPASAQAGPGLNERIRFEQRQLMPPDPLQVNPALPAALAAVLLRSLAKDPAERFSSTQAFFTATCEAVGIFPGDVPDRVQPIVPTAEALQPPMPQPQAQTGLRWGLRIAAGIGLLLVLGLVVGSGILAFRSLPLLAVRPSASPVPPDVFSGTVTLPTLPPGDATLQQPFDEPAPPTATARVNTAMPPGSATPAPVIRPTQEAEPTREAENNKDGASLIYIPAGQFAMGLDVGQTQKLKKLCEAKTCLDAYRVSKPVHTVILDAFWLYRTEVTNAMYAACVADGACRPPANKGSETRKSYFGNSTYDDYPVVYVNWMAAEAYCGWAGGRLPTEAEWEYAARGPKAYLFPWGDPPPDPALTAIGNYTEDTVPVGSYPAGASPFGVLNMSGNVFEWVSDWFTDDYYSSGTDWINPVGPPQPEGTSMKSIRGGAFSFMLIFASSGVHVGLPPESISTAVGFRCAFDDAP